MKINEKNLSENKEVKPASTLKTSHFQAMLSRLQASRRCSPETQNGTLNANDKGILGSRNDLKNLTENIDILKESDPEYFAKGVSKKTLAETFSSRFGTETSDRIEKFKPLIESKAAKYNVDPNLLAALVRQESNFNPYAVSSCGAMGLGQLMPETARSLGVTDPFNAAQNLDGAANYLSQMLDRFGGNIDKALAAYNAGPGAVKKFGGVPPYRETQHYVRAIHGHHKFMLDNDFFALNSKDGSTKKA